MDFLSSHVMLVISKRGKIYIMMEVMVKKMTTPMLMMLIRKWRVWNLTKGSIRVMEWASALSADGYWTNTILSDLEWISSDQLCLLQNS